MNRVWTGVAAGVLAATVLVGVGIGAYRAGQDDDDGITRVVTEQVDDDGEVVRVVERDGWRGPGFGFFLFPLIVIGGIILLTRGGRRHHWGHGGYGYYGPPGRWGDPDDHVRAWHRRLHEADERDQGRDEASPDERPAPPDAG